MTFAYRTHRAIDAGSMITGPARAKPGMRLGASGLALTVFAAGCIVGPDYQTPGLPVPATWIEAQQSGFDTRSDGLSRWWTQFNDSLLSSLIERAARSNLDLRLSEARIREARALREMTGAGAWPSVEVSGSYTRIRNSENALPLPSEGGPGSPLPAIELEHDLFRSGFDASWEIDLFGRVRRRVEAAEANVGASVEERRDVLVTLLGDVAKNYIDLRGFQRRLTVTRANFESQKEILRLTTVRFRAGLASDLDVARAEAQASTIAAAIPALETFLKQSAYRLDLLLGETPGALSAELSKEAPIPAMPPEALVGLPSDLLRRRPDIRRAERQLAAATAETGAAMADLFPRFSLTGAGGLQSFSASDWFTAGSRFWTVGPTVHWPIFDAGNIRSNIKVQSARQEQALRRYEKAILTALQEVESSLVSSAKEQARHHSMIEAVAANRRALEAANELYLRGLEDFLHVLDAERALYAAENDLAASEAAMASNLVSLYKAVGGGWEGN